MAKEASGKAPVEVLGGISPVYGAGEAGSQGMMRITRGDQVRWIWPVHLPGWQAVGWQVSPLAASLPGIVRSALTDATAAVSTTVEPSAAAEVVSEVAAEEAKPATAAPQATPKQKSRSRRKASAAVEPAPAPPEPADVPAEPTESAEPDGEARLEAVADDLLINVLAD